MDVRENKIKLSDGAEISYDKCLIATGETNLHTRCIQDVYKNVYPYVVVYACAVIHICACVHKVGYQGTCK